MSSSGASGGGAVASVFGNTGVVTGGIATTELIVHPAIAPVSNNDFQVITHTGAVLLTASDSLQQLTSLHNTLDAANTGAASFAGTVSLHGGSNTSVLGGGRSSPAVVSGVAFTPNGTSDSELTFSVSAAGTLTLSFGASTGAEITVFGAIVVVAGTVITKRIPMGWKVIITLVTATIADVLAVNC